MIEFYDREGRPITMQKWSRMFEDIRYRVVASNNVNNIWISTIWLGLDLNYGLGGPPLLFETMVFDTDNITRPWRDIEMRRYSTEAEAREGHAELLELVTLLESTNTQPTETGETE